MRKVFIAICICNFALALDGQRLRNVLPDTVPITAADLNQLDRQKDNKDFYNRIVQFSDVSWVCLPAFDRGSEKKWYMLSADISPHFFIGGERMPFAIALTPRYRVRIFRDNENFGDSSLPVRTPSFMPGLTFYVPLRRTPVNVYKDVSYLSIAAFHHSNGQDGQTFKTNGEFNLYNGNFSTNYIEIGVNKNWRVQHQPRINVINCNPKDEDCNQCPPLFPTGYHDHVFKGAIEQHFGTAFEQRGTYGRTRLNLKYMFINVRNWQWLVGSGKEKKAVGRCFLKEHYRVIVNASINLDKLEDPYGDIDKRINFDAGIFQRIAAGNTSVFLMAGYYGNDPYNIYYSQKYWFIRAGLALGFFVHTSKISD